MSYLPGQRAAQLATVAGDRKRLYFMRERVLELGPVGEGYLTELIHQGVFRAKSDTRFGGCRTPVSGQVGHPFRSMADT